MDKSFEKQFELNVARLKDGKQQEVFTLDEEVLKHFQQSDLLDCDVKAVLDMTKNSSQVDAIFHLSGKVVLRCDRCLEPYDFSLDTRHRIIFSFDEKMGRDDNTEIIYVNRHEDKLSVLQELYDFMILAIPFRKVPEPEVHLCKPEVLELLGLDAQGRPKVEFIEESERETDPRWEALRKLKDKLN
ncbi:MAG: DUF177 domain-containing protein [Bacteroidota bacterium]